MQSLNLAQKIIFPELLFHSKLNGLSSEMRSAYGRAVLFEWEKPHECKQTSANANHGVGERWQYGAKIQILFSQGYCRGGYCFNQLCSGLYLSFAQKHRNANKFQSPFSILIAPGPLWLLCCSNPLSQLHSTWSAQEVQQRQAVNSACKVLVWLYLLRCIFLFHY